MIPAHDHYRTRIGICHNRGEEKLWQFQLLEAVKAGITDSVTEPTAAELEAIRVAKEAKEQERMARLAVQEAMTGNGADYRGR